MNKETHSDAALASAEDEISLVEIINAILRNWRVVVVLPALLVVVVAVWSLTRERTYVASASFIPHTVETGGAGGAADLAQQFGVSLGTQRPGQSPQFYVDLMRSRTVLREVVEAEYQVATADGQVWTGTLVDYWDLREKPAPVPPWRRATEMLGEKISASVRRETGVFQLAVSADHPLLAEQIAGKLLELLNQFNLEVRQSRALDEGRFITARMQEAGAELLAAENALQDFLRQNRQFQNSPELTFEYDRLQRQVLMRQEVYTSLLRSQEQTRLDAVRDIPLFSLIDDPAGSAQPQGRGTILSVLLAFVVGLMLAAFVAFVRETTRRSRETNDPHYREFRHLARRVLSDIRHPDRWLRPGDRASHRATPDRQP